MLEWSKVRFQSRCKVCKLYRVDKKLFEEIHELVLDVGFAQTRAVVYANKKIEKLNEKLVKKGKEGIPFFNFMNFNSHFRNHLPIDLATALKIRQSRICCVKPEDEETERFLQDKFDETVSSSISEYEHLTKIVDSFEARFRELDSNLDKTGLSWENAQDYSTMVKELHRMRSDLIKLKRDDKLVSVIIAQVLQEYTVGSLKDVTQALEQVRDELSLIDRNVADRAVSKLRQAIVGGMESNARLVVEGVKKQFKLKL